MSVLETMFNFMSSGIHSREKSFRALKLWYLNVPFSTGLIKVKMLFAKMPMLEKFCILGSNSYN